MMRKLLCWLIPVVAVALLVPAAAVGQDYELGVGGGWSYYTKQAVTNPSGEVDAGFGSDFGFSAWMAHDMYEYVGGEARYTFQNNDAELTGAGADVSFGSESHTLHYELQMHTSAKAASVRPFFSVGGGAKWYRGKGEEQAFQPHQDFALLTKTSEWKPMVTFGGGVKIRVGSKVNIRLEVKDYFGPIPTSVIQPSPGASLGGWLHNLVPMAGIGMRF